MPISTVTSAFTPDFNVSSKLSDNVVATANNWNKISNTITYHIDACLDSQVQDYIAKNWDSIQDKIDRKNQEEERKKEEAIRRRNRKLRGRIKHVHWSGNTCIVYWWDNTTTKAHWNDNEPFDAEKAILVCIARKYYENTGLYNEALRKYEEDGNKHRFYQLLDEFGLNDDGNDVLF